MNDNHISDDEFSSTKRKMKEKFELLRSKIEIDEHLIPIEELCERLKTDIEMVIKWENLIKLHSSGDKIFHRVWVLFTLSRNYWMMDQISWNLKL